MAAKPLSDDDYAKILRVLRHLQIIVPSLDRIGSAEIDMTPEEGMRVLSDFINDWKVTQRLAEVRFVLSKMLDYDEIERLYGEIECWTLSRRKPPADPDWIGRLDEEHDEQGEPD